MNDNFFKRHQKRPEPLFVETLYQKIEKQNKFRRFYMYVQRMRLTQKLMIVLVSVLIFAMAFSSEARAAIISLFSFSGVEVFFDDTTNQLFAEGDEGAIKHESGDKIVIYGAETNELFAVWIDPDSGEIFQSINELDKVSAKPTKDYSKKTDVQKDGAKSTKKNVKMVKVTELGSLFPDFQIPTDVPDGYILTPVGTLIEDSLGLNWYHQSEEETLFYLWGESALKVQQKLGLSKSTAPFAIVTFEFEEKGNLEVAVLHGETDGVPFIIYASDSTLTEDQLLEMLP